MKQRLTTIAFSLMFMLSIALGACGSLDKETRPPILPADARGQVQTQPSADESDATSLEDCFASAILAMEEQVTIDGITADEGVVAFRSVLAKHPEIFWLTGNISYITSTQGNSSSVEFAFDFLMPPNQVKSAQESIENAISALLSGVKKTMSDFEKALYLHDSIVSSVEYNHAAYERSLLDDNYRHNGQTAYGCLVEGSAVCSGYAKGYQLLLQRVSIPCQYVTGVANGGSHAWNIITLDGDPYYVDITWDDPSPTADGSVRDTHEFFCITTEELLETHTLDANMEVPYCSAVKYDYYRYFNLYMEAYDPDEYGRLLRNSQGSLSVKFGSCAAAAEATRRLSETGEIFKLDDSISSAMYWYSEGSRLLTYEFTRK